MKNLFGKTCFVSILLSIVLLASCSSEEDNYVYPDEVYGVYILNTQGNDVAKMIGRYGIALYPYIGIEGVLEYNDFEALKHLQKTLMYLNLEKADIRSFESDSTGFIAANTLHTNYMSKCGRTAYPLLKTLILPRKLTEIGDRAFSGARISELTMYNNLKIIGDRAFENCCQISSINLPKSLMSIGENAFVGCKALTEVSLPSGVKEMYENSFDGQYVKSLYMSSGIPPVLKPASGVNPKSASSEPKPTIYVPKGSKASYESHSGWSQYKIIEQ